MPNPVRPRNAAKLFLQEPEHLLPYRQIAERLGGSPLELLYKEPNIDELERFIVQAAERCTDCGIPGCVKDKRTPLDSRQGCPLNNPHVWLDYAARGDLLGAVKAHNETTLLYGIYGALCYAPCEVGCIHTSDPKTEGARSHSGAVSIKDVEFALFLWAYHTGNLVPPTCRPDTGKHVAIVGAGPAGLEAAHQLRLMGHSVTVFDALPKPGGLVGSEIPPYKMKEEYLDFTIDLYRKEGINFVCGHNVKNLIDANELKQNYDAVLLCTGAPVPKYPVFGRSISAESFAPLVTDASQLLASLRDISERDPNKAKTLNKGKRFVIHGNGFTTADCIGMLLRTGADYIYVIDKNTTPKLHTSSHDELFAGRGEVITRNYLHNLEKTGDGKLFVQIRDHDEVIYQLNDPIDMVIAAIGYHGARAEIHNLFGVELVDNKAKAHPFYGRTDVPWVYCAGDNVHGSLDLPSAGGFGIRAGRAIHRDLMGIPDDPREAFQIRQLIHPVGSDLFHMIK